MDSSNPRPDEKPEDLPPPEVEGYRLSPESPRRPTPPDPRGLDRSTIIWQDEDDIEQRQFSLLGLLGLTTLIGVLMAPAQWLPIGFYAAFLGVASLVLLALLSILQARQLVFRLAFWCVLAAYMATCVMACREVP